MRHLQVAGLFLAFFDVASSASSEERPDLESRIKGTFFGALVADALTLGSHYEYDAKNIKQAYGGVIQKYMAPGEAMGGTTHGVGWGRRNYHPGQKAGDQTDYGEYNVLVLEHLAARKGKKQPIKLEELVPHWRKRLESPTWGAWKCTQTKQALQQVAQGTPLTSLGGGSNAMAIRHAAAHAVFDDEEAIAKAARTVMFTHRNEQALGGGEYFGRVAHKIIHKGMSPREAIDATAKQMGGWWLEQTKKGIAKFEEATNPERPLYKEEFVDDLAATSMARLWDVGKSEPIKVGKASPTEGTLPTSVYLILKYQGDFDAGVKANAMIGGDSASRSIAVGMVLGAYHGVSGIPKNLQTTLNAWKRCEKLLAKLPLLRKGGEEL